MFAWLLSFEKQNNLVHKQRSQGQVMQCENSPVQNHEIHPLSAQRSSEKVSYNSPWGMGAFFFALHSHASCLAGGQKFTCMRKILPTNTTANDV